MSLVKANGTNQYETIEEAKAAARHRAMIETTRLQQEKQAIVQKARAIWESILDQVYADYPCLEGHVDETLPEEWRAHNNPEQVAATDVAIRLKDHADVYVTYYRDAESYWRPALLKTLPYFRVALVTGKYQAVHDLGEALVLAEREGLLRSAATKVDNLLTVTDDLVPFADLDPAAKLTAALQEFIEHSTCTYGITE